MFSEKTNNTSGGYNRKTFRLSKTFAEKLIKRRNENLYINLPKLKTHSMGIVTLGITKPVGISSATMTGGMIIITICTS